MPQSLSVPASLPPGRFAFGWAVHSNEISPPNNHRTVAAASLRKAKSSPQLCFSFHRRPALHPGCPPPRCCRNSKTKSGSSEAQLENKNGKSLTPLRSWVRNAKASSPAGVHIRMNAVPAAENKKGRAFRSPLDSSFLLNLQLEINAQAELNPAAAGRSVGRYNGRRNDSKR